MGSSFAAYTRKTSSRHTNQTSEEYGAKGKAFWLDRSPTKAKKCGVREGGRVDTHSRSGRSPPRCRYCYKASRLSAKVRPAWNANSLKRRPEWVAHVKALQERVLQGILHGDSRLGRKLKHLGQEVERVFARRFREVIAQAPGVGRGQLQDESPRLIGCFRSAPQ